MSDAPLWRERAARLADDMLQRFVREDGSFAISAEEQQLLIPVLDEGDSEAPSGTSAAIELLLRLASRPEADPRYGRAAQRALEHLSGTVQRFPTVWASTIAAVNVYPVSAPELFHIPVTADHVRVTAARRSEASKDQVVITIEVDDGYHINANPASFDYLIPTAPRFENLKPAAVKYPKAARFRSAFAPDALDVYEGRVQVIASFPKGALPERDPIEGAVDAQACDQQVCLPPSELPFSVPPDP